MRGLRDKKVLVTGGSSGIGQAIAVKFAEYGCDVAINYFQDLEEAERAEDMLRECRQQVHDRGVRDILVQGDVSKEEDVERIFATVLDQWGGLDFLINNAGIQIAGESHETGVEQFDRVIATNLRGAYMCARKAIQHFLNAKVAGAIVNISSVHQIIPKPRFVGYSASKGGMQNLTRTLALEYANRGIRVNAVGPGATVTPINRAWVDDPDKRSEVERHIPMGRAGTSEEIAETVAYLCSDLAGYITGQTIYVDGGLTLYPDFRTSWSSE